ncbi:MAG: tetratricopeptide repeat protein [bacterium]
MIKIDVRLLLLVLLLFVGCGTSRETITLSPEEILKQRMEAKRREIQKDRALSHFIKGSVYDSQELYAEAVLEYQDALREDSDPAIFYALSKDYSLLGKQDLAAQSAREAVRLDSQKIAYRENLATIYLRANQQELAANEFRIILAIDSMNTSAWYNLAQLTRAHKPLESAKILERILEQEGDDWNVLLQAAELYQALGHFDQAAAKYRKMLELDPSNSILQRQLAEMDVRSGRVKEAQTLLEDLIEKNENDVESIALLADLHLERNEFIQALALYDRILKKDNKNPEVRLRVGIAYFGQIGKDSTFAKRAKSLFEEMQKEIPNDWRPYWYLGAIAARGKEDSIATDYMEHVIELAQWNGDAWWFLGSSLFDKGEYQKLLEIMEKARKSLPKDHRVYLLTGLAYTRMDRQPEAIEMFQKALELKPDDMNTLSSLALTLDGLKRFNESDTLYEKALKLESQLPLILNNYSYSLAERGIQLQRALKMALKAIEAEPNNPSYLDTVGWIYFKLEKFDEAEQYVKKALQAGEASATVHEHLGDIYYKLGKKDQAKQMWRRALDMDTGNQTLREKLARGLM